MFNLFELMQRSQSGDAVETLARQFGLSAGQAASAVDALLPAFMLGLQQSALKGAGSLGPEAFATAMARAFAPDALHQGQPFAALFGSADLGRRIAEQAALASGVSPATLQQMMPAMAGMMAAGAARSFAEQGMDTWMKAFQAATPRPGPKAAEPPAPNPFDPAGMASLFGRMMGLEPDPPEPPKPTSSDLGLDAVTQFVETGREVQEDYLRSLQALFAGLVARSGEEGEKDPA